MAKKKPPLPPFLRGKPKKAVKKMPPKKKPK